MSINPSANTLLQQGIAAYNAGQREQAEQLIRQAVAQDSNTEQGWLWLAAVLRDLPQVEHALQQALAHNPSNRETATHLATVRQKLAAERGEMFKAPTGQRPAINPTTMRQSTAANAAPAAAKPDPAASSPSSYTPAPSIQPNTRQSTTQRANLSSQAAFLPQPSALRTQHAALGPPFAARVIYFLFVGWWLTYLWVFVAWAFNLTIIGLPIGLTMLNLVPQVLTLEPVRRNYIAEYTASGRLIMHTVGVPQLSLPARALYFFLIGWWASLGWMMLAATLCATLFGLPLGIWMFHRSPTITTLRRL